MTRVLADLLGLSSLEFVQRIRQLERLSGHPGADIRLASEMQRTIHEKLRALGLDGHDTTGPELFEALGSRLKKDELALVSSLNMKADGNDMTKQLARLLSNNLPSLSAYGIKNTAIKKIFKANAPKKTMKSLGYRSLDSMLKHEDTAPLLAAAELVETPQWRSKQLTLFAKLSAKDFEPRKLEIVAPLSARWNAFAGSVVSEKRENVLAVKELGAVVILPLPADKPRYAALVTAVLAINAANEVRAAGTYLKLHQMRSNFRATLKHVLSGGPLLFTEAFDEPVSWHHLLQFFDRLDETLKADVFEPLVHAEELAWESAGKSLARIHPKLEFWNGTDHLGMLQDGQVTTFNVLDLLLTHNNKLPFNSRILKHFKEALHGEILLSYLKHDKLEQVTLTNARLKLVPEMAGIDG